MRKSVALLYLLATIVLFASAASKPEKGIPPCPPCCYPCSDPSVSVR